MDVTNPVSMGTFGQILESNKNEMTQIQEFKKAPISVKPRNIAFGGMVLGSGLLFILFASQIITGMFALILTVGTAVGGYYGLRFLKSMDPLIQQKTKNAKLKWMVREARKNAVYQLDNQIVLNKQRLSAARQARDKMGALVAQMESKINPANEGTPNYKRKVAMLQKVDNAYQQMRLNLDKGAKANEDFKKKVREYKDMDSFASLADEAMSLLGSSGAKELEEMLSLESFNEIEMNFNTAIVQIENSARDFENDM